MNPSCCNAEASLSLGYRRKWNGNFRDTLHDRSGILTERSFVRCHYKYVVVSDGLKSSLGLLYMLIRGTDLVSYGIVISQGKFRNSQYDFSFKTFRSNTDGSVLGYVEEVTISWDVVCPTTPCWYCMLIYTIYFTHTVRSMHFLPLWLIGHSSEDFRVCDDNFRSSLGQWSLVFITPLVTKMHGTSGCIYNLSGKFVYLNFVLVIINESGRVSNLQSTTSSRWWIIICSSTCVLFIQNSPG